MNTGKNFLKSVKIRVIRGDFLITILEQQDALPFGSVFWGVLRA